MGSRLPCNRGLFACSILSMRLSDVYYDKQYLERLRQMETMKPQATLEFDDARQVVVRWH